MLFMIMLLMRFFINAAANATADHAANDAVTVYGAVYNGDDDVDDGDVEDANAAAYDANVAYAATVDHVANANNVTANAAAIIAGTTFADADDFKMQLRLPLMLQFKLG